MPSRNQRIKNEEARRTDQSAELHEPRQGWRDDADLKEKLADAKVELAEREQPVHPENWMKAAARELRIIIHNMDTDYPTNSSDNPANKRWLDAISAEDAKVIAKHFGRADSERWWVVKLGKGSKELRLKSAGLLALHGNLMHGDDSHDGANHCGCDLAKRYREANEQFMESKRQDFRSGMNSWKARAESAELRVKELSEALRKVIEECDSCSGLHLYASGARAVLPEG